MVGKLKRIRNNPSVELAPRYIQGRASGHPVAAVARILPPSHQRVADRALAKKYGLQKRALNVYHYLGRGRRTYLAIESTAASAHPGWGEFETGRYNCHAVAGCCSASGHSDLRMAARSSRFRSCRNGRSTP